MEIGSAIKEIRKKKGYLQKDFAVKCEISTHALCQIEQGNTFPKKGTIDKICKALDIPLSYLLFFTITEDDIPEHKRDVFKALSGLKELLIN